MRVRYAVPAQADLDDIYNYIADNNPAAAERVTRQIKADAELLGEFPHIARASELPGLRGAWRRGLDHPYPSRRASAAPGSVADGLTYPV
jgi:plasmid stabilization system protein ParE